MHFFFRSNKVLQRTSSHHCQSGGVRARAKLFVRLGTSLLFQDKSNGNSLLHHGIFFFLSRELSYIHSERFLIIFFLCCARISSIMNAKKISKFEREEKSNGNPLLHHGIFLSFHEKFPIYIQKDSL